MATNNSWNSSDPVDVADGGTGVSTLTDGGVILGSGTGAVTSLAQATNGQLVVGSTGADPVLAVLTDGEAIDTSVGAGSITIACETATDTNLGVATFDENDFLVTAGDVTIANRTRLKNGYTENLGVDYNGGTGVFSIQGADAALSSTNPGWVAITDADDPGETVLYEITANQSFIDDVGTSEIIGNLFGLPTGVAYGQDLLFYIYAVPNDAQNTVAFMISRTPTLQTSPAAANIGAPDDAVADLQSDFWSFDNIDETLFDSNPTALIGTMRMQMSASDDWTVQMSTATGIGLFNEGSAFIMPLAAFGASTGTFLKANGGTAPVFTDNAMTYYVSKDGWVDLAFACNQDGGTDGVGAVTALIALPYIPESILSLNFWAGFGRNVDPVNGASLANFQVNLGTNEVYTVFEGAGFTQNGDYSSGSRTLDGTLRFRISDNL